MLTREQLKNRLQVEPVEIEVEELGGSVYVLPVNRVQRRELAKREEEDEDFDSELWLIENCVCDADGSRVFVNGDREWLASEANARMTTELAKAVLRGNGWTEEEAEDIAGN